MKIVCKRSELLGAARRVAGVIEAKSTSPILATVLIDAGTSGVTADATDLVQWVHTAAPCETLDAGGVAMPARDLIEMLDTMPEGPVHLESGAENKIVLRGGKRRFTIQGMPAEDYPSKPTKRSDWTALPGSVLIDLFKLVGHAKAGTERPNLAGVHLTSNGKEIEAFATDGRYCCAARRDVEAGEWTRYVPSRAVASLETLIGKTERIEIALPKHNFAVRVGATVYTTKLLQDEPPDWRKYVPAQLTTVARAPRKNLALALRAAALVDVECLWQIEDGKIVLRTTNPDRGEVVEEIDAETTGPTAVMALEVKAVRDTLDPLTSEDVEIKCLDSATPVVVGCVGDERFTALWMPLLRK